MSIDGYVSLMNPFVRLQDLGGVRGEDVPFLAGPQPVRRVAVHEEVRPRR